MYLHLTCHFIRLCNKSVFSDIPCFVKYSMQYLDENKKLILAILDNQNLGKLAECAQWVSFSPPVKRLTLKLLLLLLLLFLCSVFQKLYVIRGIILSCEETNIFLEVKLHFNLYLLVTAALSFLYGGNGINHNDYGNGLSSDRII